MNRTSPIFAVLSAILTATALLVLKAPGEPGVAMRDFEAYYSAGAAWLAHADPYSLSIWSFELHVPGVVVSRYEVLPFVGIPSTLPLWAALAHLSYDAARLVWSVALALCLATIVLLTARLSGLNSVRGAVVALASLAFVPITSDFGLGQAAMPAYAATLVALAIPSALGSVAIFLAALQPNVALGLIVLMGTRAGIVQLVAGAALVAVVCLLARGWNSLADYVHVLAAHASAERFAAIQYTPAAVLYGFGVPQPAASALAAAVAIVAIVAAAIGVLRSRSIIGRFCIASAAIPFVAGFFHEHDFVALFTAAIFAVVYGRRSWAATLGFLLVGVNWLDFAQQPQACAQDVVLAGGLLCAAIALRPERPQLYAVAGTLAALAAGAAIGQSHHLPIWPNDMHGLPSGATIAEVWKNEQLQSGLLRPGAAAAFLRALALLGSALVLWSTLDIDVHHIVERRDRVGLEVL